PFEIGDFVPATLTVDPDGLDGDRGVAILVDHLLHMGAVFANILGYFGLGAARLIHCFAWDFDGFHLCPNLSRPIPAIDVGDDFQSYFMPANVDVIAILVLQAELADIQPASRVHGLHVPDP